MGSVLLRHAKELAAERLWNTRPHSARHRTHDGYLEHWQDNLIEGVDPADCEDDLNQGDGNELHHGRTRPAKFCAAYSSSALAVNTFAPFKHHSDMLTIGPIDGFTTPLHFEAKCPNGLKEADGRPARAPNLDLLAHAGEVVVAVESKFLEPLARKKQEFSPKYEVPFTSDDPAPRKAEAAWTALYKLVRTMKDQPLDLRPFRHLDAAQLVKHYLGLRVTYDGSPCTLVYLYWEPANADDLEAFIRHRNEVRDFGELVSDSVTRFVPLSYPELWRDWEKHSHWPGMPRHLARLRERYSFSI